MYTGFFWAVWSLSFWERCQDCLRNYDESGRTCWDVQVSYLIRISDIILKTNMWSSYLVLLIWCLVGENFITLWSVSMVPSCPRQFLKCSVGRAIKRYYKKGYSDSHSWATYQFNDSSRFTWICLRLLQQVFTIWGFVWLHPTTSSTSKSLYPEARIRRDDCYLYCMSKFGHHCTGFGQITSSLDFLKSDVIFSETSHIKPPIPVNEWQKK